MASAQAFKGGAAADPERLRRESELLQQIAFRKSKVLVADDMPMMRMLLAQALGGTGFDEVLQAADGIAALKMIHRQRPGLALLDWNMPNLDGLAVLEAIRADEELRDMVVIMVTAENTDTNVLQAASLGHDDYLIKPISPDKLSRRLGLVLAKRLTTARARRLEAMGLVDRAADEYLMALRNRPASRWPYYALGELYARQGRIDEAKQCYQRLIRHDPAAVAGLVALGKLAEQHNETTTAQQLYRWAMDAQPQYSGAAMALADSLQTQGLPGEALEVLDRAVAACDTPDPELVVKLAMQQIDLGRIDDASGNLGAVAGQAPAEDQSRISLALAKCRLAQDRRADAAALLRRAANRSTNDADKLEALLLLMETHIALGNQRRAARLIEEISDPQAWLAQEPPLPLHRLLARAAKANLSAGELATAAKLMAVSLAMAPNDASNASGLTAAFDKAGQAEVARRAAEAAADDRIATVEHYSRLGVELASQGRHDQALEQYRRGLWIEPRSARLHFNIAKLHLRAEEPELAEQSLARARAFGVEQTDWELLEHLAQLYVSMGDASLARKVLLDIVEHEPERESAQDMLDSL